MANILVVISSARKGRVADTLVPFVTDAVEAHDGTVATIADLQALDLPFYNEPISPATPGFSPSDERAVAWTQLVADADGIVFLTPEYNHAINGIQKNAIDWIKHEWQGKPVSLIAYGWAGGEYSIVDAQRILEYLETKFQPTIGRLYFTKQLAPDGSVIDEAALRTIVAGTIDELIASL